MSKNAHRHVITLVVCGLLTALGVILGGLLSIPAVPFGSYSLKIGFGVLPVILSGVLFGPAYGGIVGALTDLIQALLFPKGAYMPWFTVVGIFFGLVPGLFFMKKQKPTFVRLLAAGESGRDDPALRCAAVRRLQTPCAPQGAGQTGTHMRNSCAGY